MRSTTRVVASWANMHALIGAEATWLALAAVSWFAAKATIPPFLSRNASGAIPVVLLVPLLAAAAASFCAHHESPRLLQTSSRSLFIPQAAWLVTACVAPGALLSAGAALRSGQIDVAAVERNVMLLCAFTFTASRWLAPGIAVLPAFCYSIVCYALAGHWLSRGLDAPVWAALLHRTSTFGELAFAAALFAASLAFTCWRNM